MMLTAAAVVGTTGGDDGGGFVVDVVSSYRARDAAYDSIWAAE